MMKKLLTSTTLSFLALGFAPVANVVASPLGDAPVDEVAPPEAQPGDAEHMGQVLAALSQINALEIETAQVAQQKSQDKAVLTMAALMIQDHSFAQQKVQLFATEHQLDLATLVPDAPMQGRIEGSRVAWQEIAALDAAAFDQAFWEFQVAAHTMTLELIDEHLGHLDADDDSAFKFLLNDVRPGVEKHLRMAQEHAKGEDHHDHH